MSKRNHETEVTPAEAELLATLIGPITELQLDGCWTLRSDRREIAVGDKTIRISQNGMGYAQTAWHGRPEFLHSLILAAKRATPDRSGKVYKGEDVLHSCDNHRCLNPDHLRGGSSAENAEDRLRNGLQGDTTNRSPLDTEQKGFLKYLAVKGLLPGKVLAKLAQVSEPTISAIRQGRLWKDIPIRAILVADIPLFFPNANV